MVTAERKNASKRNYTVDHGRKIDHMEARALLVGSRQHSGLHAWLKEEARRMISSNPPQVPGFIPLKDQGSDPIDRTYCQVKANTINEEFKTEKVQFRVRYNSEKKGYAIVSREQYESVFGKDE